MAGLTLTNTATLDRNVQATHLVAVQSKDAGWQPAVTEAQAPQAVETINLKAGQVLQIGRGDPPAPPTNLWRLVGPGVMVRDSEYQLRYAHLDLVSLRARLSPEKFLAFVRHIGVIQGREGIDIGGLAHEESR